MQKQDDSGGRLKGVADAQPDTPNAALIRPLLSSPVVVMTAGFLFNGQARCCAR